MFFTSMVNSHLQSVPRIIVGLVSSKTVYPCQPLA